MDILLSNWDMNDRAGTQRWVGTIAAELQSRGHLVKLLTPRGNTLYPWIPDHVPGTRYDLGILNHFETFKAACKIDLGACIYTAHGFTPPPEWAPPGADAYVAVDELTAAHLPWRSQIIRNPIDLNQFQETRPVSAKPKRALFLSNKQGKARDLIEAACELAGLELKIIGNQSAVDDPAEAMNWADIVFCICRGVFEALACNRNVYVLDLYGAKGFVRPENLKQLRTDNFAGLLDSYWPSPAELAAQLTDYDPTVKLRDYVEAEHSPAVVVDRYLELASQISARRRVAGRAIRSLAKPIISRRVTKCYSHLRLGNPAGALRALRGAQDLPPLLPWKLPPNVKLSLPAEGLKPT